MRRILTFAGPIVLLAAACGGPEDKATSTSTTRSNPLDSISTLPFQAPPFDKLTDADHRPAIERGMAEHRKEAEAIATNPDPATFENTIVAMEQAGMLLRRARAVFFNLTSSATNDSLQAVKADLAPKLTAHKDAINLDPRLFARVKAVHDAPAMAQLDAVSRRLVERYYQGFVRAGALLGEADKKKLMALNEEETTLATTFGDNILKEVTASAVLVDDKAQLEGMSADEIAAAAAAAKERGQEGKWLIALRNTTTQPALAVLKDRGLRERIFKASVARNAKGDALDNRKVLLRMAQVRAEKAKLLGFPNWAAYVMDDQMAKTPEAATELLGGMAPAAAKNARAEAAKLQAMMDKEKAAGTAGGQFKLDQRVILTPWDWDYYAEQVRKAEYDLDEAALKPYFEFERVLQDGVFFSAQQLFGLTFTERKDLPVYHPDVRVFNIIDSTGATIGLFYGDYFARDNKQGGAWMDSFVEQSTLLGQQPVITQNCNYVKPAEGQPCLLSFDDVNTLFHEFGHALHGMLSRQKYPFFSGTSTPTDFVEFPSQFNENWALDPMVLANYAKHHKTGEPMPADLSEKLRRSGTFNQGYMTSEYLASALLDIEWHSLSAEAAAAVTDVEAFEQAALAKYGLDPHVVPPRYKSSYFSHIWGGGYAAGYYAYMWSEVLEADAFAWCTANGGMTRANGDHLAATVMSRGGSVDAGLMFRDLTGRDPQVGPLLKKRGLQ